VQTQWFARSALNLNTALEINNTIVDNYTAKQSIVTGVTPLKVNTDKLNETLKCHNRILKYNFI